MRVHKANSSLVPHRSPVSLEQPHKQLTPAPMFVRVRFQNSAQPSGSEGAAAGRGEREAPLGLPHSKPDRGNRNAGGCVQEAALASPRHGKRLQPALTTSWRARSGEGSPGTAVRGSTVSPTAVESRAGATRAEG